jgi:hypothetical protein
MKSLLRALRSTKSPKSSRRAAREARLELEPLEAREVPTVTNQGGAVLSNVRAQALYLGSDWLTNSSYLSQSRTLSNFLGGLVNGPYMDMLQNAGYGVGRGSFYGSGYFNASLNKTQYLTDTTIRDYLTTAIDMGWLLPPTQYSLGGNNLYVVFVEDNVAVSNSSGTSVQGFTAYHTSFFGGGYNPIAKYAWSADIHYVVVPYAGGSIPLKSGTASNGQWSFLSTLNSMTMAASHEVAEAVTDPDVGHPGATLTWYDKALNNEIGDIANERTVYLNGFAVQRLPDKNDQPMTPAGATAVSPVNFVLSNNGSLYVGSGPASTYVIGGVADISDQSIDDYGHAMIDVVFSNGVAEEYHAGFSNPWVYLGSGVRSAKAGQGTSYVLYTNGTVQEYLDWGINTFPSIKTTPNTYKGQWKSIDTSGGVVSIDAGTDRLGVSMMTEVWSYNIFSYSYGYEYSDSTSPLYLGSGIRTLSAGQMGNIGILYKSGIAIWYVGATSNTYLEGQNVNQFTMGTDENGYVQFDVLLNNGNLSQFSWTDGWTYASGLQGLGKAHAGVEDVIFSGFHAKAYYALAQDWGVLYNGAVEAA